MRILVVDQDKDLRHALCRCLERGGHKVTEANTSEEAQKLCASKRSFDAVVLDHTPPETDALQTMQALKRNDSTTVFIILRTVSEATKAVQAVKPAAFKDLKKPVSPERLLELVNSATQPRLQKESQPKSIESLHFAKSRPMIGVSQAIKHVFNSIQKLSRVDTAVLIRGESGTGKELVARALHDNSPRNTRPFVAINCAAIPENLIESELFGHEKGAFTGADRTKIGKVQYAEGGTLFLDEIGDMSQNSQVKILRLLQEKTYYRLGSHKEIAANIRIIAATNQPLEALIVDSSFRADLFYRLNVLPISLPPLRERKEDIEPLTAFLLRKFNDRHKRCIRAIRPEVLDALEKHSWPGNIRELENVMEHAVVVETHSEIGLEALPASITQPIPPPEAAACLGDSHADLNYPALKEQFERDFLVRALRTFRGRINKTAAYTKIAKVTLLRKIGKYGIDPTSYRDGPAEQDQPIN